MFRRLKNPRRIIILGLFLLSYILLMTFGGCADRLILFPTTEPINAGDAARRTISWRGGNLEIWTARSPAARLSEPEAFVLQFTGNATRAEHIAAYEASLWGGRPVEVWVVNYPGYGRSTGPARLKSIPPASLATYDALKQHADGRPIFLAGNSLGTAAALHVAANRPVDGMILQNPPPLRSLILRKFGWWNLWLIAGPIALQVPKELDSVPNARQVNAPGIFLLSDQDDLVTPFFQKMVADAYAGEKKIIRIYGGHNDAIDTAAAIELESAMDWLWERTRQSRSR